MSETPKVDAAVVWFPTMPEGEPQPFVPLHIATDDVEFWKSELSKTQAALTASEFRCTELVRDSERLDFIEKTLHIDGTGDEPIFAMFVPGIDPTLKGDWSARRIIDAALDTAKEG